MYPHSDRFLTYEPLDSSVIFMGNDAQCNVVGIGTTQIKTHEGIVRTFTKVLHIPYMTRNFIALGTLESNECRYPLKMDL